MSSLPTLAIFFSFLSAYIFPIEQLVMNSKSHSVLKRHFKCNTSVRHFILAVKLDGHNRYSYNKKRELRYKIYICIDSH